MKRLFYTEKTYDYSTLESLEKDIKVMKARGYKLKEQGENGGDEYKYTAVYYKER